MAQERQYIDGHLINFSSGNGYPTFWDGEKNILVHRYVWEKYNGKIPSGYVVHHKDRNRLNYSIDNLELKSISEHHRHHAVENGFGKFNKGKLKKHSSGFCKGATPVRLTKNNIILEFNSVTSAAKYLNVNKVGYVSRVLTGKRKSIRGYKCEYVRG